MPLLQIPRFVRLIICRCLAIHLSLFQPRFTREVSRTRFFFDSLSFSLLDRSWFTATNDLIVELYMHLCRSIANFFPNFVSIESKIFILRRFFISKFNQAVLNSSFAFIPLIAFLFLESRVWFAVAWLSFVVLVGTNWKIYGSLTVVLHSFFFLFTSEALKCVSTNLPLEISKSFPYWIFFLKNIWQSSILSLTYILPHKHIILC